MYSEVLLWQLPTHLFLKHYIGSNVQKKSVLEAKSHVIRLCIHVIYLFIAINLLCFQCIYLIKRYFIVNCMFVRSANPTHPVNFVLRSTPFNLFLVPVRLVPSYTPV